MHDAIYPTADHDARTATYNKPAPHRWLLKHKRLSKSSF